MNVLRDQSQGAFSLVELMMVVAIIGILTATAIPSFSTYTAKAKISEAYVVMGNIAKAQRSFFIDNQRYYNAAIEEGDPVSSRHKPGTDLAASGSKLLIDSGADYSGLGEIVGTGTYLNFVFYTPAGGFDGSGTEIPDDADHETVGGSVFINSVGGICSVPSSFGALKISDLTVKSSPPGEYYWFVTSATGNFAMPGNGGTECAALFQTGTFENGQHSVSPFVQLN